MTHVFPFMGCVLALHALATAYVAWRVVVVLSEPHERPFRILMALGVSAWWAIPVLLAYQIGAITG